jgi:hypothetical protein
MRRTRSGLVLGLAVLALAVAGCGGDDEDASDTTDAETTTEATPADGSTLTASVGPGFEISLTGSDGADVTSLPAGSYTIEVDDQSDIHNFHLSGGTVDDDRGRRGRDCDLGGRARGGRVLLRLRPARRVDERKLRSLELELS